MNELRIENITKKFKTNKKQKKEQKKETHKKPKYIVAADNVSFTLKAGEIYGLLGPNGAGKTTTLRMIASLLKPETGAIYYNGEDVYDYISEYRKIIGFLTSELKLDDFFTPDYTFTYMARLYGLSDEEIKIKKDYLFDKFGINDFKDLKIKELSTGMKQKVSLAISLCHDPEIIIFDEPTNGLDIVSAKSVENFLLELKQQGKIILISTHIFSLVEKLCDRVGIIIEGRLVYESTMKELTQSSTLEQKFFEIYDKESKHHEEY